MEYTLILKSQEDYNLIKKILKAFDGASIRPKNQTHSHIEQAFEEVRSGKIEGPFNSATELMDDLLN